MTTCTRCGNDLAGTTCLICGKPVSRDGLTEFCRSINCTYRRLMDDVTYLPKGRTAEEKRAALEGACRGCEAWRYDEFLRGEKRKE